MKVALLWLAVAFAAAAVEVQQYHSHDFTFRARVEGNAFDVQLRGYFTGPDGMRLQVPGFYDGDGAWKIRFSPTRVGQWSLRTASPVPALDGKTQDDIQCTPNRDANIHGALRVDPAHPHHFLYEDGTRYFLLGYEADWLWGVEMKDPQRKSMRRLIDQMAARGFNHVLVNVYAHDTRWAPGKSCPWDYGPPEMYAWEGSNDKPDHSRLNPRFFQLYDGMMEGLRAKGIVAHIMLKVYNKQVNWPAKGSADEEKYFRYVVARYQAYCNVVWDFSKESYNEKDELLQARLIDLVRSTDAYGRLTTAHDDDEYEWNPGLGRNLDFRTDQQHSDFGAMILFDRWRRDDPVVNAEFGYEYGVEKLPTHTNPSQSDWQEFLRRAYHVYLAGGYGVYYYNNTAWDVVKPDPEPPGMQRFQWIRESLEALPYRRMVPSNHLAVGGPCLALEGEAYACYVEGGRITVNLSQLDRPESARAEWMNTWEGARETAVVGRGGVVQFRKPTAFAKAPALLVVRQ